MFRKIIVPIDIGVENSFVLERSVLIAQKFSSELHIIHIIPNVFHRMLDNYLPINWLKTRIKTINNQLRNIASKNIPEGMEFITFVSAGSIQEEIINYSDKHSGDLIILFSLNTSHKNHMLGYNMKYILKNAQTSVLLLRK